MVGILRNLDEVRWCAFLFLQENPSVSGVCVTEKDLNDVVSNLQVCPFLPCKSEVVCRKWEIEAERKMKWTNDLSV
jgi:hypothetical protein